jgi:hypothetical protein
MTTVPPSYHDSPATSDEGPIGRCAQPRCQTTQMQPLDIQGYSYEERQGLLPALTTAFADCGGWILDRKTLSPSMMEFRVEIQLRAAVDLYASIVASGLELTRAGHLALTELCSCRRHQAVTADLSSVVSIRIEISFLDDMTLHSLLMTGAPLA